MAIGKKWKPSNADSGSYHDICYGDGIYVAGGSRAGLVWSEDGMEWEECDISGSVGVPYKIDYNQDKGIFVASFDGCLCWSTDGQSWTKVSGLSYFFDPVCAYDGGSYGCFVAGTRDDNGIYFSFTGKTFKPCTFSWEDGSESTDISFNDICYSTGTLVASSSYYGLWYSDDGQRWYQSNVTSGSWGSLAAHSNMFLACSNDNKGLMYSVNGEQWQSTNQIHGKWTCASSNGKVDDVWVAGHDLNALWYATDVPENWTLCKYALGTFNSVHYSRNNDIWVAGSDDGIMYSENGINWTGSDPAPGNINCIYSHGDMIIASTQNEGLWYSTDEPELERIEVYKNPTKTKYNVGEKFDKSGLVIRNIYSDGTKEETTKYKLSTPDMSTAGTKTITVTSTEDSSLTTSFTIDVIQPTPKMIGIEVKQYPTKRKYQINETFDPSGLLINKVYDTGDKEETTKYKLSTPDMSTAGTKTITVTSTEDSSLTTSFTIDVIQPTPSSANRIHFINVSKFDDIGDCILLESNGHFALIDTGEGHGDGQFGPCVWVDQNGNPGVRTYLKKVMENTTTFDFILITHCHSDHVGNLICHDGAETGIFNPNGTSEWSCNKVYMAEYSDSTHLTPEAISKERAWNNQWYYDEAKAYFDAHTDIYFGRPTGPITFGDMIINMYDPVAAGIIRSEPQCDENCWSYITHITCNNKNVLLLGDTQNDDLVSQGSCAGYNLEKNVVDWWYKRETNAVFTTTFPVTVHDGPKPSFTTTFPVTVHDGPKPSFTTTFPVTVHDGPIPPAKSNIDLLKLGHHGLVNSGHDNFINALHPLCIVNSGPMSNLVTSNGLLGVYNDPDTGGSYARLETSGELNIPIFCSDGEMNIRKASNAIQKHPDSAGGNTSPQFCDSIIWDFSSDIDKSTIEENTGCIYKNTNGEIKAIYKIIGTQNRKRVYGIDTSFTMSSQNLEIFKSPTGKNIVSCSLKIEDTTDAATCYAARPNKDKILLEVQKTNGGDVLGHNIKITGRIIVED